MNTFVIEKNIQKNFFTEFATSGFLVAFFLFFIFALGSVFYKPVHSASAPATITYQGRLLQNGLAVTTSVNMAFSIYSSVSGGTPLYTASGTLATTNTLSVTPSSGLFAVNLGGSGTNSLDDSIFAENQNLYLQVVIGGTAMSPRRQLVSAPYAINSQYLMGVEAQQTSSSQYIPYSDPYGNFEFIGLASSTAINGGLIYLNPSTTDANETLFGIAVNDDPRLRIDEDGDIETIGGISTSGTAKLTGINTTLDYVTTTDADGAGIEFIDSMVAKDNFLYVANNEAGMHIYDITNPAHISLVTTTLFGADDLEDIDVVGNYVYAAYNNLGLYIIDITNNADPKFVTSTAPGAQANGVLVSGNYAYVARGVDGLQIYDVSNPREPIQVGGHDPGATVAYDVDINGNYLYVGDSGSIVNTYDITDPTNPLLISQLGGDQGGADGGEHVEVQGNKLYVGSSGGGLRIVDVSDPASPTLLVRTTSFGTISDVDVSGDYAYLGANGAGARVVDITSSTNPILLGTYSSGDSHISAHVHNGYFYSGTSVGGIYVLDIGGVRANTLSAGNIYVGDLSVQGPARFENVLHAGSGLNVESGGLFLGGDFSMFSNTTTLSASNTLKFSHAAHFTASSTRGPAFVFDTANPLASNSSTYAFSVRNNGTKLFSVAGNGDVAISGNVYASAANIGTPGTPGDLAERVDIAPDVVVEPGDVVIVDPERTDSYTVSTDAYDGAIAGVISTKPSIVVGDGQTDHTAVMALTGRVPIKVSTENGAIARGDLLVSATLPGHAMKYDPDLDEGTGVVAVIGVALEPLEEGEGKIMGLVRTGWVHSKNKTITSIQHDLLNLAANEPLAPQALNVLQQGNNITTLSQNLNANGFYITNVGSILGKENRWKIDEQGRFITTVETSQGDASLYSIQTQEETVVVSGSGQLQQGIAQITFDQVTQDIIDEEQPIRVSITLTDQANGTYVRDKGRHGFTVEELKEGESNATFDWVAIIYKKEYVLEEEDGPANEPEEELLPLNWERDLLPPIGAEENPVEAEDEPALPPEEEVVVVEEIEEPVNPEQEVEGEDVAEAEEEPVAEIPVIEGEVIADEPVDVEPEIEVFNDPVPDEHV